MNKPENFTYEIGTLLTKTSGSNWTGRVVGFYSTDLTPEGYAIESETEKGSVQIYPSRALKEVFNADNGFKNILPKLNTTVRIALVGAQLNSLGFYNLQLYRDAGYTWRLCDQMGLAEKGKLTPLGQDVRQYIIENSNAFK